MSIHNAVIRADKTPLNLHENKQRQQNHGTDLVNSRLTKMLKGKNKTWLKIR